MLVQRVLRPGSGRESWTLLGDDGAVVEPAERYLAYLTAIERSPNTVRAYAISLKLWFEFLQHAAASWDEAGVEDVARFVAWLRALAGNVIVLANGSGVREPATVNRHLAGVFGFYNHHARTGLRVAAELVSWRRISRGSYKPFLHHVTKGRPIPVRPVKLDLIAQRNPIGAHHGDLRLQIGAAAISGTAMHGDEAKPAALVKAQRIHVVIGGNDPKAGAPLLRRQPPDRLDHGGPRAVPLPGSVESKDLALLPVPPGHIREHPQQAPARGLSHECRMLEGMDEFPQPGHPGAVMPGEERLCSRLVGRFSRPDLHRINVTVASGNTATPGRPVIPA